MNRSITKGVRLYGKMAAASIRAQMQYRYAFFMNILGWAMSYAGTAVTMWVMLSTFHSLKGWTFWELLFLFALSILSWSICILFFFHFRSLDQYIVNGTFDRFLVRPIHPFLHFIALKFDVGAFGQLLFSVFAVCLAYTKLHLAWPFWKWAVFAGTLFGGTLIQGGLLVLISAMAFWTTRSERFYWVVLFPMKNLMNYPLTIYPQLVQWVVTFVLPFAFVNYLPALVLLEKGGGDLARGWGMASPVVGGVFFWICYQIWLLGLNRYKSAGS
jgi:ABC-2 type transport system permease protein